MDYEYQLMLFFLAIGIIFYIPFLRSFFKILILLAWGLFLPGMAISSMIINRISGYEYIGAFFTLLVVFAIQIPWFLIGWPEIKSTVKNGEWGFR